MFNQRMFYPLVLMFLGFLIWEAWQKDYGPKPSLSVAGSATAPSAAGTSPTHAAESVPNKPLLAADGSTAASVATTAETATGSQRVLVKTDVFELEIDTLGGDVRSARLPEYPVSLENKSPLPLLADRGADYFVVQSGFMPNSTVPGPTHFSVFNTTQTQYHLADGQNTLEVPLTWDSGQGLRVTKTYVFTRGSYAIDVRHQVDNQTAQPWVGALYTQLLRAVASQSSMLMPTYTGGVIYTPDKKYEKIAFDDLDERAFDRTAAAGWVAVMQHYFFAAWIPQQGNNYQFYGKVDENKRYQMGLAWPSITVAQGQSGKLEAKLYVGPKIQSVLKPISEGLELTVDYGVLTVIAKPLFWLLDFLHGLFGNWGVAIILLTLIVKALFFKLSEKSYRSMAGMRKLQPRMQAIKERYGDDKERFKTAMMQMYQEEKINPFGGCLPILVQMPVFLALYWVLLESVELRQAPFMLWIYDLSVADPYFVLPLLMGATMFLQQKLNPAPMDPVQQKVMMFMPVMFTVMFLMFPAGLVLYWVVNNSLSILQQWLIMRRVDGPKKVGK
jgi:YidC/Oxa1 family membrane protein insertase